MKKLLLLLAVLLTALHASAYNFEVNGIYYNWLSDDKSVMVTYKKYNSAYNEYSSPYTGDVTIPSTVTYLGKTYSVTSIGENAFCSCDGLTSVVIGNSVTTIGESAFSYCSGLTSVVIPNSVTTIGRDAFYECSSLTSVEIPNSVTKIGSYAFSYCTSLTSVVIPNSVTEIGYKAFYECSNLPIENNLRYADTYLVEAVDKNQMNYTIKEGTRWIGSVAFSGCSSLTSVVIPNSVTSIGESAFSGCSSLTSAHITDLAAWCKINFYSMDSNPLYYAHNLYLNGELVKNLVIPNSITSIGDFAFEYCSGLTSVEIPNSVTEIGRSAFSGCSSLTSVEIPNSVTSIGSYAFSGCSGLKEITSLNPTPPNAGSDCFYNVSTCVLRVPIGSVKAYKAANEWKRFANIIANTNGIPSNNYILYTSSDGEVVKPTFNGAFNAKIVSNTCESGQGIILFDGEVTEIGNYAFADCSRLTSVVIPNSVTSIGQLAFNDCSGLTSVVIPNSVTSIGGSAFYGCSSLTSVVIPNSVTSIGAGAFSYCSGLTSVVIPNSVTEIGNSVFYDCDGLTSVEIPGSVTKIGNYAFYDCDGLTSVEIPGSVTKIRNYVFYDCDGLTSVEIPGSVTEIGDYAFYSCSGLTSVVIGNSVTSIGSSAFWNCSGLTSVVIPNSVTSIGDWAFCHCSGLTSVEIGNSVTTIGEHAFYNSFSLKEITSLNHTPPSAGSDCFDNVPTSNCVLRVPKGSKDLYAAADEWKKFNNITGIEAMGESITLSATEVALEVGERHQLTATMLTEETEGKTVTWTSSNEDVATVSADGMVTATGAGTAVITATYGTDYATCTVTVFDPKKLYTLGTARGYLPAGENLSGNYIKSVSDAHGAGRFRFNVNSNGVTIYNTNLKKYLSADGTPQTAYVSTPDGTFSIYPSTDEDAVKGRKGTWIIKSNVTGKWIMFGGSNQFLNAESWKIVDDGDMWTISEIVFANEVQLSDTEVVLYIGYDHKLTAKVLPENTMDKDVTWTSSNTSVATVSDNGMVTGIGKGTAVITAACGGVSARCSVTVKKKNTATTCVDVLRADMLTATNSNYKGFSNVKATSEAIYAGQSATSYGAIQLRSSNSNSGIVTTASGGHVSKVAVQWDTNTASDRKLNIYGSNTPYTSASDLYGSNAGTLLGTIVYGRSTKLVITDEYKYIGLRSSSGAMYLYQINITWTSPKDYTYFTPDADKYYTLGTARGYMPAGEEKTNGAIRAVSSADDAGRFRITGSEGEYTIYNASLKKYLSANGSQDIYVSKPDGTFSIHASTDEDVKRGREGTWIIKSNETDNWIMFNEVPNFLSADSWKTVDDGDMWTISETSMTAPGDVNGDGDVDVLDVTSLIGYIIGESGLAIDESAADVNGDGSVDVLDVTTLIGIIQDM